MHLYIKNMVCNRCIMAVREQFTQMDVQPVNIQLGEVELEKELTAGQLSLLKKRLDDLGFELLDDNRKQLIEKIKNAVIDHVHYSDLDEKQNFSEILSNKLFKDYSYLSGLFSEVEGITIEKYIINQKIERVKELLVYDQLNLSEIAFRLGYSSVAHLSSQFKKVTGLTPTHFKRADTKSRKELDKI